MVSRRNRYLSPLSPLFLLLLFGLWLCLLFCNPKGSLHYTSSYDTSTLFGKLLSLDNEITSLDPDLKPEASAYSACVPWGPSVSIADSYDPPLRPSFHPPSSLFCILFRYDHLAETPNLLLAETFEILTQIQEEHGYGYSFFFFSSYFFWIVNIDKQENLDYHP